jgi:hypothetical protein
MGGRPGVPYSDVLIADGEAHVARAPVTEGGSLARIPYRYRHTAVLTQDVRGFSMTVSGVQASTGAPGFYAGTFASSGGYAAPSVSDMWCFLPGVVGGERETLCLLRNHPSLAAIAPTRLNPYLWTQFSPATGSFDLTHTPIFERRAVDIPGDLTLEYRFERWTRTGARLKEFAGGREVREFDAPFDAQGLAEVSTIAGTLMIAPAGENGAAATARLDALPAQ